MTASRKRPPVGTDSALLGGMNHEASIAQDAIALAAKHLNNGVALLLDDIARSDDGGPEAFRKHISSASLCHSDAIACLGRGDYAYATQRAIASLRYSVGIFHADYYTATRARLNLVTT